MGYKELDIRIDTNYSENDLKRVVFQKLKVKDFSFQIINKSLDARNKKNIVWQVRLGVESSQIKAGEGKKPDPLNIEYKKRNKKALVVGSGPAGFFAAFVLQKSGIDVVLLERGCDVDKRAAGIERFEKNGQFNAMANYAFGEGGAGTFSDGKLTSRSKHISKERQFILSSYVEAGAPAEIAYMAHPHVGSDNLKIVVANLRKEFVSLGGKILFETMLKDLKIKEGKVFEAITDKHSFQSDYFIIAPGHSAYETYAMLIEKGIPFRTKNFALGSRVEHPQEIINKAQWGVEKLNGVKAAEYRLTSDGDGRHPVYTFCMCPGGVVVPATPYEHTNIVNGMSLYQRDGRFANAACVAGIHPEQFAGKAISPLDTLKLLEELEHGFYELARGYKAPFCSIEDFLKGVEKKIDCHTSYPLGTIAAPLWEYLPDMIVKALREGIKSFSKKLFGYESGILLGLESKTSSPVQAIRDNMGRSEGFENLYLAGEGSGYAGGIISSAADGVKMAMNIINSL